MNSNRFFFPVSEKNIKKGVDIPYGKHGVLVHPWVGGSLSGLTTTGTPSSSQLRTIAYEWHCDQQLGVPLSNLTARLPLSSVPRLTSSLGRTVGKTEAGSRSISIARLSFYSPSPRSTEVCQHFVTLLGLLSGALRSALLDSTPLVGLLSNELTGASLARLL